MKLVDNDARYSYSALVSVDANSSVINKIVLSPNPVVNKLMVTHIKALPGATITITSAEGRIVVMKAIAIGSTQTSIDASGFAKASYFVSYQNGSLNAVEKFIK